ncbi:MAG: phosphatase PAP2 family protein [Gemmatimonadales bacterium]
MSSGASTIVQTACQRHKSLGLAGVLAVVAVTLLPSAGCAQAAVAPAPVGRTQILSVAASGVVFLLPGAVDLREGPPGCAPCSRSEIPWYDRWALTSERDGWSAASTVSLVGLAGATWYGLVRGRGRQGLTELAASVEAASWAVAVTQLSKAAFARNRPVLYTSAAAGAAGDVENRRSLPSGHASAAFALATSYALAEWRRGNKLPGWLALAAAGGIGTMRVLAGRHFPSDVATGAAIGSLSAVVVHRIRF